KVVVRRAVRGEAKSFGRNSISVYSWSGSVLQGPNWGVCEGCEGRARAGMLFLTAAFSIASLAKRNILKRAVFSRIAHISASEPAAIISLSRAIFSSRDSDRLRF